MKPITGYFNQELKVGDRIAWVAKSCGSIFMADGIIHSIEEGTDYWGRPKAKVKVLRENVESMKWNRETRNWETIQRTYVKRIFNWETAITLNHANFKS